MNGEQLSHLTNCNLSNDCAALTPDGSNNAVSPNEVPFGSLIDKKKTLFRDLLFPTKPMGILHWKSNQ
jgi:hypothetical protein